MSGTLGDDWDEDDSLPGGGGSLDLERGGAHAGPIGGAASSYDSDGMDFDDDPFGDGSSSGPLELDLPHGSAAAVRNSAMAPGPAPSPGMRSGAPAGPAVPDLSFGPPPVRSSGQHGAVSVPRAAPIPALEAPPATPSSSQSVQPAGQQPAAAPPSASVLPARPTAAAVIAKYPDPPQEIWRAPKYAIKVVLRQLELRSELESLRRRRSPDVPLYESALRAYEPKTFRLGFALNVGALTLATFIFFLPVILRFLRAD